MTALTLTVHQAFETATCSECGITSALPAQFRLDRQNDGKTFHCPNGHAQCFGEGDNAKLRRALDARVKQVAEKEHALVFQRQRAETAEAEAAKVKRKAARNKNGVCQCCNRTFSKLAHHMATKHPEWKP